MKKILIFIFLLSVGCAKNASNDHSKYLGLLLFTTGGRNPIITTITNVRNNMVTNSAKPTVNSLESKVPLSNSITRRSLNFDNSNCWFTYPGSNSAIYDIRKCFPNNTSEPNYTEWLATGLVYEGHGSLRASDQKAPDGSSSGGEGLEFQLKGIIQVINSASNTSQINSNEYFQNQSNSTITFNGMQEQIRNYWGKSSDKKYFYVLKIFYRDYIQITRIKMDIINKKLYIDVINPSNLNRYSFENMDYTETDVISVDSDGNQIVQKETGLKIGSNTIFTGLDILWGSNIVSFNSLLSKASGKWFTKFSAIVLNNPIQMNNTTNSGSTIQKKSFCFDYGTNQSEHTVTLGLCTGSNLSFSATSPLDYNFALLGSGKFLRPAEVTLEQLENYYLTRPITWTNVDDTDTNKADSYN